MSTIWDNFTLASFEPAYAALSQASLQKHADNALAVLEHCDACPRRCRVNRGQDETGICGIGRYVRVSNAFPHTGEEACLRGQWGSGTIFFSGCNLNCVFCQNWDISQRITGAVYPPAMLAEMMLELQHLGCHNINFVTPEHVAPQVLEAICEAVPMGLKLPIVYNTSAYDSVETLRLFDGIVDIYMPDFKFWDPADAERLCHAQDYPERARAAIAEMHRQVGVLKAGEDGIARRGVLLRHLVMPGKLDQSRAIFHWLSEDLSPDTFVNIMGQYRPEHEVPQLPAYADVNRKPTREEILSTRTLARAEGLWRFAC